ncbi:MAG: hypothetical protein ABI779_05450 [Acidobacteriota bacterium]
MRRLVLALALTFLSSAAVGGEVQIVRGRLIENLSARADATQTYTLYLPNAYDPAKRQPLLFVFDPRGRGTAAAEIFRPAAEEYGWILISSNQTQSDGSNEPNERALRALVPEAGVYATDPNRLYATGFSGTAMLSYLLGIVTGKLAGVIAVGGRVVSGAEPAKFSFAHYGFSGDRDFNNREMRLIDTILDREGKRPHRFRSFSGVHSWISPELARDAIGWMEVVAKNRAVVPKVFGEDLAAARDLKGLAALRHYRAIVRTYEGLVPLDEVRSRVNALEADASVRKELAEETKWDEFERRYQLDVLAKVPSIMADLRAEESPAIASDAARAFRVGDLLRHASRPGAEGAAATRLLESVYAQLVHGITAQLFSRQQYALATAILGAATTIHPERWSCWYNLGAAYALLGNSRQAYGALDKAIAAGFGDAASLEADTDFASLRRDKRFAELLGRMRQ